MFHPNIFSTSFQTVFLMISILMMGHIEAKPVMINVQLPCILTGPSLVITAFSPRLATLYCRTKDWMGNIYRQKIQNEWPWRWTPNIYHGPFIIWQTIWRNLVNLRNLEEQIWGYPEDSRPTCHVTHFLACCKFFPRWHWYKQPPTQPLKT